MTFEILLFCVLIVIGTVTLVCLSISAYESHLESRREELLDPCPKCGSKHKRVLHIDVSNGYQYYICGMCGHKFKDTSESEIRVGHCGGEMHLLSKPDVDQDGEPIQKEAQPQ